MQTDRFLSLKQYGGYTMLIFAATHGYIDILEYLIKLGADVNEVSNVSQKFDFFLIEWRIPFIEGLLFQ
jgi:hypothetical protein